MRASASLVVSRPPEDVFAFIADVQNMDRWVTGVSEPQRTSDGDLKVGSTLASKYTYSGRTHDITYVVTEYDPPSRFGMKSTSGPFPFEGLVELESVGDGTKVTNTIDAGSDSTATSIMFALLGPVLRIMMRRQLRKELLQLKAVLEAE